MENVSLHMDGYFRRLNRFLNCPKILREPFLHQTRQMAEDFVQGKPDATAQEVADFLGDPRELAQGFLETLEPEVLERHQKRKKLFWVGLVAVLAAALVVVTCWALKIKNGPVNVEVTETIVIYPKVTED